VQGPASVARQRRPAKPKRAAGRRERVLRRVDELKGRAQQPKGFRPLKGPPKPANDTRPSQGAARNAAAFDRPVQTPAALGAGVGYDAGSPRVSSRGSAGPAVGRSSGRSSRKSRVGWSEGEPDDAKAGSPVAASSPSNSTGAGPTNAPPPWPSSGAAADGGLGRLPTTRRSRVGWSPANDLPADAG